jgi:hypothetical protein
MAHRSESVQDLDVDEVRKTLDYLVGGLDLPREPDDRAQLVKRPLVLEPAGREPPAKPG